MITGFDHIALSAKDPEAIRDFLIELLDLEVAPRPPLSFDGYFLRSGEQELIHIFSRDGNVDQNAAVNPNIVHHVAFNSDNYEELMERVTKLNVQYSTGTIPDTSIAQVFVRAPENLLVEIKATPSNS